MNWIKIEDELPNEDYYHCLIYCPQSFPKNIRVIPATFYGDNNLFYGDSSEKPHEDATHWMPLPNPPTK